MGKEGESRPALSRSSVSRADGGLNEDLLLGTGCREGCVGIRLQVRREALVLEPGDAVAAAVGGNMRVNAFVTLKLRLSLCGVMASVSLFHDVQV